MNRLKRALAIAVLLAVIGAGATLATGALDRGEAEAASNSRLTQLFCNPAGTWVGNSAAGSTGTPLTYTEQFTPVDLRTLNYRIEFKNVDATWGPFVETDTWIGMEGIATLVSSRKSRGDDDDDDEDEDGARRRGRSYEVAAIGYGIKEVPNARGEIQHITTMIGRFWVNGCNEKLAETVLRVYDYTQMTEVPDGEGGTKMVPTVDQDLNGIPDEDAVPMIETPTIPFPASKRVRLGLPN